MLEQATGSTWEDMIHVKLFDALGMSSCGFGAPASDGQVGPAVDAGHVRETPHLAGPMAGQG